MAYGTAGAILTQAANELGLPSVTDPVAATDAISVQLEALLNKVGRDLSEEDWKSLTQELVLTTDGVTNPITLPTDFRSTVDQTWWDRTQRYQMLGPLTSQQWQKLIASVAVATVGVPFRIWKGKLYLYPLTGFPAGRQIACEYNSSNWIVPSTNPTATFPTSDTIAAAADVIWFDKSLMVAAVKLAWKREKGFDSTAAQQDYAERFNAARDDDADSPIINAGNQGGGVHLLNADNLPDTGWGT